MTEILIFKPDSNVLPPQELPLEQSIKSKPSPITRKIMEMMTSRKNVTICAATVATGALALTAKHFYFNDFNSSANSKTAVNSNQPINQSLPSEETDFEMTTTNVVFGIATVVLVLGVLVACSIFAKSKKPKPMASPDLEDPTTVIEATKPTAEDKRRYTLFEMGGEHTLITRYVLLDVPAKEAFEPYKSDGWDESWNLRDGKGKKIDYSKTLAEQGFVEYDIITSKPKKSVATA